MDWWLPYSLSCRHQCSQILCVHAEDKVFHKLIWFEGHNLEDFIYLCLLCRDIYPFLNCNSLFLYSHRLHLSYGLSIHLVCLWALWKSSSSNFKSPLDVTLNLTSLSNDPMERNGNILVPGRWDKQRLDKSQRIWGGGYIVVDVKCMLFQNTLFVSYYRIELPSNSETTIR